MLHVPHNNSTAQLSRAINQQRQSMKRGPEHKISWSDYVYEPGQEVSYRMDTEQRRLQQQEFGSLKCPDQIQAQYSFLFNGFRGILPRGMKRPWSEALT